MDNGLEDRLFVSPLERAVTGQHLIEQAAKRPDICALVDLLAERLLGRHVGHRPHHDICPRQVSGALQPGQTEVHDLGLAFGCEHDIGRLDIPMDDSFAMRFRQSFSDLESDVKDLINPECPLGDLRLEASPFDKGHGDIRLAVLLPDLIDSADVGMVQGGGCLGLADKPLSGFRRLRKLERQKFQSDRALEPDVFGLEYDPHSAPADLVADPVFVREDRPFS